MRKTVNCGKCPREHGPYWFAAWKEGGKTRWRYIGSDGAMSRVLAGHDRDRQVVEDEQLEARAGELRAGGRYARARALEARGRR